MFNFFKTIYPKESWKVGPFNGMDICHFFINRKFCFFKSRIIYSFTFTRVFVVFFEQTICGCSFPCGGRVTRLSYLITIKTLKTWKWFWISRWDNWNSIGIIPLLKTILQDTCRCNFMYRWLYGKRNHWHSWRSIGMCRWRICWRGWD